MPPSDPTPPRRPRRWLGSVVAIAALLLLGALAWWLTQRSAAPAPGAAARPAGAGAGPAAPGGPRGAPPSTVGTATAAVADIPVWLDALGTVTPSATVTVRPQVSGVLLRVHYTEGQMVRAGQLLAELDPRPFELALMQASGQRQRDEAQLANARLTLQRYQTLLQQDSIARQDVDTQAALVRQLEGTVVADQAAEGTARLNLAYTRITAPVEGRVGLRVVDVGNVVSSGDANGIVVITRLAPIDVEFAVPQDRLPEIQRSAARGAKLPVTALDRTRSTTLDQGTFSTLNNQVDEQTGTVRAKARFANAASTLFPSQFVNVRLLLDTLKGSIVVPDTALRHGGSGDYVFVLRNDRTVELRNVKAGLTSGDRVAIVEGLKAGEVVVTEGADRLKEGSRVILLQDAAASAARRPASGASGARGGRRGDAASGAAAPALPAPQ